MCSLKRFPRKLPRTMKTSFIRGKTPQKQKSYKCEGFRPNWITFESRVTFIQFGWISIWKVPYGQHSLLTVHQTFQGWNNVLLARTFIFSHTVLRSYNAATEFQILKLAFLFLFQYSYILLCNENVKLSRVFIHEAVIFRSFFGRIEKTEKSFRN